MKRLLFAVALMGTFLSSCGDDEVVLDPSTIGEAYYPLEVGTYKIFNVAVTTYEDNEVKEEVAFQERELVNQMYKDQAGKDWYRVEISRRQTSSDPWQVSGVRSISREFIDKTSGNLVIQENNRKRIHMVFPVVEGKSWNAYGFDYDYNKDDGKQYYSFINVNQPFKVGEKVFDNSVRLVIQDFNGISGNSEIYEILSLNEGPVYRYTKQLNYCSDSQGIQCPYNEEYIINGTERIEELESSGKIDL
ncbi:hypothetical protein GU926_02325 [Nibribacter ruber]|uniref:DUF4249 family protein n=1 Tax=Nibribacter ruber TaxID=2698458 RepID=A0A6P1NWL0_9BACT|nr:hypothetical protein [Nibribacter ruber]QHL86338.1 hypothetical protein GU926_02325 [Nibribacter ruber]